MSTKVLLVSPNRFLNTTLNKVISADMQLECESCGLDKLLALQNGDNDNRAYDQLLLLLDFMGFESDMVFNAINQYHDNGYRDRRIAALYNVSRDAGIEKSLIELGVRGVFYDDYELDLFQKGISSLLEGEIWFPRKILFEHIRNHPGQESKTNVVAQHGHSSLTPREEEILILIASGKTNAEIAEGLFISPSTVKTHVYNIFQKINVPNRIQAALWTVKNIGMQETQGHA